MCSWVIPKKKLHLKDEKRALTLNPIVLNQNVLFENDDWCHERFLRCQWNSVRFDDYKILLQCSTLNLIISYKRFVGLFV